MRIKLITALLVATLLTLSVSAAEPVNDFQQATPAWDDDGVTVTVTEINREHGNGSASALPGILPVDIQIRTEQGVDLLIKTFEVPPYMSAEQLAQQSLERGGIEYTLREVLRGSQANTESARQVSQTVTISTETDRREDILSLLLDRIEYRAGGYAGWLYLDESSISTEAEGTQNYTRTVNETREFHGLARNDPYLIPKTIEVRGATFQLSGIQWRESNPNDRNSTFSATAAYTGRINVQTTDGFTVTAQYIGQVMRDLPGNVMYTIIYEPVTIPGAITSDESNDSNWGLVVRIILIALGILVCFGLGVFTVLIALRKLISQMNRRNSKGKKNSSPVSEPEARYTRRKPHALGYMKRDE